MFWQSEAEISHLLSIPQKRDRQVDREIDRTLLLQKILPIRNRTADHELGQGSIMRILVISNEISRWNDAPGGMSHPHQRLRTARNQGACIDLLLIPQFEPAGLQRLGHVYCRARSRFGR